MTQRSLARSGHESNGREELDPRVLRGQRLFRDHAEAGEEPLITAQTLYRVKVFLLYFHIASLEAHFVPDAEPYAQMVREGIATLVLVVNVLEDRLRNKE